MTNAILIKPNDTVVTVIEAVPKGGSVSFRGRDGVVRIETAEDIPLYHKVAVKAVEKGGYVYKYGEKIGRAMQRIEPGSWVHTHNIESLPPGSTTNADY
jgi:altronate dehydratase